jgi:hypothetical protein
MSQSTSSTIKDQVPLSRRMLVGAGIGLLLISLFLLPIKNPNPEWGKFWMIRPFIIVPFAGAMGGLCNYYIMQFNLPKIVAVLLSVLVFVIGLWIGFVLGLDGTLWN